MKTKLLLSTIVTLLMLAGIFFTGYINAQIVFQKHYGGIIQDKGFHTEQTSDGGYIVAGQYTNLAYQGQAILLKANPSGDSIWSKTYGTTYGAPFNCVRKTTDGCYIACGTNYVSYLNSKWYLVKTTDVGDTVWTKNFGGGGQNQSYYVEPTTDGGYILGGFTQNMNTGDQISLVIKTDAQGDSLWSKVINNTQFNHIVECVRQTTDGGYVLTGVDQTLSGSGASLVKLDSTGAISWAKQYGTLGYGKSVIQTTDGGYILTGRNTPDLYIVKTYPNGDSIWTKSYIAMGSGGSGQDIFGSSIQSTTDGGYIIGGYSMYQMYWPQMYLFKTTSTGDSLWAKAFGSTTGACEARGYGAQQTTDGGYVLCGETTNPSYGNSDIYLIKTDSSGNIITGIADGDPFVNGEILIYPNPFNNFTTIKIKYEELKNQTLEFVMYDLLGREIKHQQFAIGKHEFVVEKGNLQTGMYFYKIKSNEKSIATGNLIIE